MNKFKETINKCNTVLKQTHLSPRRVCLDDVIKANVPTIFIIFRHQEKSTTFWREVARAILAKPVKRRLRRARIFTQRSDQLYILTGRPAICSSHMNPIPSHTHTHFQVTPFLGIQIHKHQIDNTRHNLSWSRRLREMPAD